MPNFATSAAFVETATKCLATDFSSPPRAASDQARAVWALVMVSSVVKVFEETINRVSVGIEIADGFREIGPVDVGNEAKCHVPGRCNASVLRRPSPARGRSRRCRC